MQEKPKVVVSRTRRVDTAAKDFAFTESDIRSAASRAERADAAGDSVASYRNLAWNAFKKLSLPVNTEEAWRRTDIHNLPADKFRFATDGAFNELPTVREDLLKRRTDRPPAGWCKNRVG
jgi:hypothetical protein